jgi:uncharacterized 2Fe-2S/4Fe-4S cluster protein (DUF4445 family)
MRAGRGAVEGVRLRGESLELRIIGGGPPRGMCGSGLLEGIAAAREGGLIDRHGTVVDPLSVPTNLARLIAATPAGRALRFYRDASVDLLLTQEDIRNFQLAKGAVRAGVECLLQKAGWTSDQLRHVIITGAFGSSLAPAALKRVAMLPENMIEKVRFQRDGVLDGLVRFLLDPDGIDRLATLAAKVKPFPLSGTPIFEKAFLKALDY